MDKVLIVEDDLKFQRILRARLQKYNDKFEIVLAQTATIMENDVIGVSGLIDDFTPANQYNRFNRNDLIHFPDYRSYTMISIFLFLCHLRNSLL